MAKTITTTSTGITLTSGYNPLSITSTGAITSSTGSGVYGPGGATNWTVTNSGQISGTAATAAGIQFGSSVSTVASGTVTNLSGGSVAGGAFGVFIGGSGSVTNQGSANISAANSAGTQNSAVYILGDLSRHAGDQPGVQLLNAGTLAGPTGVFEYDGGSVTNLAGGTITGTTNAGINLSGPGTIVNDGLISAAGNGIVLGEGGTVDNLAGGTISAYSSGVYVGYLNATSGGTFTNAGTVIASAPDADAVQFSAAAASDNRLIVDPSAVFSGNIYGGNGVAELASGNSTGTLYGFGSTITNFNALQIDSGADWRIAGDLGSTAVDNQGTIEVGNSGTLNLDAAVSASSGAGIIEAGSNGILSVGSVAVDADQTFDFTDNTGTLELAQPGNFLAPIQNITIGNTIDLTSITANAAHWTSNVLTVTNNGLVEATLAMPGSFSAYTFGVSPDAGTGSDVTVTATCYAAGTRILTPRGEVPIERLHRHDLLLTISGQAQRIRWIGHRHVDFRSHPNRERILPVRIAAHAFGPGRPKRDLLLSPDHAVFVEGVLIPIRHLINGSNVIQLDRQTITYYHIELPRHDVLLAEGMPAESYLEAGARSAFGNGEDVIQLHPEFTPPQDYYATLWEQYGYAPLVVSGETLERVRATLSATRYAA